MRYKHINSASRFRYPRHGLQYHNTIIDTVADTKQRTRIRTIITINNNNIPNS